MPNGSHQNRPISPLHLVGLSGVVIALMLLLPTCESTRKGTLFQPVELFLLADQASERTPVPYSDATGTITGFVSPQPDFVINRIDELLLETRQLPIFERGRIVGKQPHRFATLYLPRRDRKALAEFSETAVGRVLLIRMAGRPLSSTFVTQPLTKDDAFVISGPADEEMRRAILMLQASYEGRPPIPESIPQK
ncbi:MAG: hypothetical protein KDN19_18025 [Verrucomicrobiae bacterium]|nr:hypothetical protein [Verrucomicrobiae bacterium]